MSTVVAIQRSPELIAAEINNIINQTRTMVLYNSIEIGRRLCEAKLCVPHGEWGTWLKISVDFSQSTANNMMRIFEEYGADQIALFGETGAKSQALGSLSYTQAVALLALPDGEREEFVENHDIDNMSTRELQKVIKELEEERKHNKHLLEVQEGLNAAKAKAEEDKRLADKVLADTQKDVKTLQETLKTEKDQYEQKFIEWGESVAQMRKDLAEAQSSGDTEEEKRLLESLNEAQEKIKELEEQLKDKPIDVTAATTVTTIPEEVEQELETLRAGQRSAAEITFKLRFDTLVSDFKTLLTALGEIEEESRVKYKQATSGLITKMIEHL